MMDIIMNIVFFTTYWFCSWIKVDKWLARMLMSSFMHCISQDIIFCNAARLTFASVASKISSAAWEGSEDGFAVVGSEASSVGCDVSSVNSTFATCRARIWLSASRRRAKPSEPFAGIKP